MIVVKRMLPMWCLSGILVWTAYDIHPYGSPLDPSSTVDMYLYYTWAGVMYFTTIVFLVATAAFILSLHIALDEHTTFYSGGTR